MKLEPQFHYFPKHVGFAISLSWDGMWIAPNSENRRRYMWACISLMGCQFSLRWTLKEYAGPKELAEHGEKAP